VYVNEPATDAVWVAVPLFVNVPVHGDPLAPPPLAAQLLANCSFHVRVKLCPIAGAAFETCNEIVVGGTIVTVTLAVAGGWAESIPGHEMENSTSPRKPAGGWMRREPLRLPPG
jgi:hypothetical protein